LWTLFSHLMYPKTPGPLPVHFSLYMKECWRPPVRDNKSGLSSLLFFHTEGERCIYYLCSLVPLALGHRGYLWGSSECWGIKSQSGVGRVSSSFWPVQLSIPLPWFQGRGMDGCMGQRDGGSWWESWEDLGQGRGCFGGFRKRWEVWVNRFLDVKGRSGRVGAELG